MKTLFFTKSKFISKRNYFLGRIFDALSIRFQTVIHNSLKEIGKAVYNSLKEIGKTVYNSDENWPVKEICEVPSGHVAGPLLANVLVVVRAEQLHAHHRKDEDHDSEDESLKGNSLHCRQFNTIECNTIQLQFEMKFSFSFVFNRTKVWNQILFLVYLKYDKRN